MSKTEDINRQDVMNRFNNGFQKWRKFCKLMDVYPKASYGELLIRLNEKAEE